MSEGYILVVDDEALMRDFLKEVLERKGFQIDLAEDRKQAINKIKSNSYDLILTDLKMPDADGMEVLYAAKEISPSTDVIIMAAYGTVNSAVEAMQDGACDYVTKPLLADEIEVRVSKVFEGRKSKPKGRSIVRNFKEAAYNVLKKEKRPLSAKEITQIALKERLIASNGKTPDATMGATIYTDIKQKGEKSLFVKVGTGLFRLKEQGAAPPEEKDEMVRMEANSIIEGLKERQFKSDSPTDFEEAIKHAFNLLGFQGELIGGKGNTDVLLTANIGQESFKVNIDGKTSKSGKITDQQIDWDSLEDHKKKNKADFVVVIGPRFSGGNLEQRANRKGVSLLKTEDLINLVETHSKFPFTLTELKDIFTGSGDISSQLEYLLTQNLSQRNLLEQFKVIIQEMQSLQDGKLGYFTFDSLAGREKIEELQIEPEDIQYIISLLKLPFINGVKEISENKYILTIQIKDISNIFQQISNLLIRPEEVERNLIETTLENLQNNWQKILDKVKKKSISLATFLSTDGRPESITDGVLTLSFQSDNAFCATQVKRNKKTLQAVLSEIFTHNLEVQCVIKEDRGAKDDFPI